MQSLAVNPGQGKLFWSDVGVDQMKHAIYMANMDGTERQALVTQQTNPELDFPKSLSFDVKSKQSLKKSNFKNLAKFITRSFVNLSPVVDVMKVVEIIQLNDDDMVKLVMINGSRV